MYYSYIEIEYVATSFSPARTDLALKLLATLYMWWFIQHQIMCQVDNWKGNLCHCLSLEMLRIVCTLSRLKQFVDHCLSLRIMVLLEAM
jgi:hypothetical protein